MSAEKEKGVSIHLNNKHFRHRRISKMLKMFIVHAPPLRSAAADYLPTGSPICSFGVTLAPKVLWGYKRQSAVCKFALCAFVPAISISFGNNFCSAVGSSGNIRRHFIMVLVNRIITLFQGQHTEKPQNP